MQTEHPRQPEQLFAPSPDTATPNRTSLAVQCAYDADGKLQRKTERLNGNTDEYAYTFDRDGRLLETRLNGKLLEAYRYNSSGQRVLHICGHDGLREFERRFHDARQGVFPPEVLQAVRPHVVQHGDIMTDVRQGADNGAK